MLNARPKPTRSVSAGASGLEPFSIGRVHHLELPGPPARPRRRRDARVLALDTGVTKDGVVIVSQERGLTPDRACGLEGGLKKA